MAFLADVRRVQPDVLDAARPWASMGMPRRVFTYPDLPGWALLNMISTIGAFILALSVLIFLWNVVRSLRRARRRATIPGTRGRSSGRRRRPRRKTTSTASLRSGAAGRCGIWRIPAESTACGGARHRDEADVPMPNSRVSLFIAIRGDLLPAPDHLVHLLPFVSRPGPTAATSARSGWAGLFTIRCSRAA